MHGCSMGAWVHGDAHRGVSASVQSGNLVWGGKSHSVHSKQGVWPGRITRLQGHMRRSRDAVGQRQAPLHEAHHPGHQLRPGVLRGLSNLHLVRQRTFREVLLCATPSLRACLRLALSVSREVNLAATEPLRTEALLAS